jgi:hypothetical protein
MLDSYLTLNFGRDLTQADVSALQVEIVPPLHPPELYLYSRYNDVREEHDP